METTDNELIEKWLRIQRAESTKRLYKAHIEKFREWYKQPLLATFFKLEPDEMRNTALEFQSDLQERKLNANTIISILTALQSLAAFKGKPLLLRRKRISARMDLSSHVLFNEDLAKMYAVANIEQKAILAAFASLGSEVSAIIGLEREHIKNLIEKAREQKQEYVYFMSQRLKTGEPRLGILNPLAIESIELWLKDARCKGLKLFTYTTKEGTNSMIKHLARDAQIKKTGRIHTHLIRKWAMSSLSRGGMNEFEVKFCVGKKIPATDMTYLNSLQTAIEEKYPAIYETLLDFRVPTNLKKIENRLGEKDKEIAELKQKLEQNGSSLRMENETLRREQARYSSQNQSLEMRLAKLEKAIHNVLEQTS